MTNPLSELHPTCKSVDFHLNTDFVKIILIELHSTCIVYSRIWRVWSEHWSGCAIRQREPWGKCSYTSRWRNGWCLSRSPTSCRSREPGKKSSERKEIECNHNNNVIRLKFTMYCNYSKFCDSKNLNKMKFGVIEKNNPTVDFLSWDNWFTYTVKNISI